MPVFVPNNAAASIHDLLVPILSSNPTWADLADVYSQVLNTNVEDPIQQLENIRAISQQTDPEILKLTARLLGFDVSQDVLNLNAENLTKIVSQLSHYPDQNGTDSFYKFIDLVLNANTEVWNLYTQDYVNFVRDVNGQPPGTLVMNGGRFFKTTHIELRVNLPNASALRLGVGQTLMDKIQTLFYNFAPVSFVIELLTMVVIFGNQDWNNGTSALGFSASLLEGDVSVTLE